jgi:prephenate dehydratase
MKNITLSADEKLIEAARQVAQRRKTTLNAEFRTWLARYANSESRAAEAVNEYRRLMAALADVSPRGRRFQREDLNER